MGLIFHQNMLDYAGGTGAAAPPNQARTRNQQFDRDFGRIQARTGAAYVVAGFTELLNNGLAATEIANRAVALDPGLTSCVVIGVGITATGYRDEHVGIAWDPNYFTIQNAGQVLFNSMLRAWECHNTAETLAAPLAGATLPVPNLGWDVGRKKRKFGGDAAADSRGVAYVHGSYHGGTRVFAFMHNMYRMGDPSSSFTSLNAMMDAIHAQVNDFATRDYVGGDFNLEPRDPKSRGVLRFAAEVGPHGYYVDTTWSHPYDFWVTNQGANQATFPQITNADVDARYETLTSHISDHAGIVLHID